LSLGNHRGPRLVVSGDALVVTAIVGHVGGGKDGDIVAWRSMDRGKTWGGPITVSDVPAAAREGLHSMAVRGNMVVVAWLDLRHTGTELYTAGSNDAGKTWGPNARVYTSPSGTICQCCHPSVAIAPDGGIVVMFRNALDGQRDFYLARGHNGQFDEPKKLGRGSWTLAACPMDGGGLLVDASGDVTTVWRREQTVFLDQPGAEEVRVADGVNPAIAQLPGGPAVAWNAAEGLSVTMPDHDPMVLDAAGKFVALTVSDGHLVAAWERGDRTVTKRIE
jgi:hypothetical protein